MTARHNPDPGAYYANLKAERDDLRATIARVEALAVAWENAETWEGKPAMVDRSFAARLHMALRGEA